MPTKADIKRTVFLINIILIGVLSATLVLFNALPIHDNIDSFVIDAVKLGGDYRLAGWLGQYTEVFGFKFRNTAYVFNFVLFMFGTLVIVGISQLIFMGVGD